VYALVNLYSRTAVARFRCDSSGDVKNDVRCDETARPLPLSGSGEFMSADYAQQDDRFWAAYVPPSARAAFPWPAAAVVCFALALFALLFAATSYLTVQRVEQRLDRDVRAGLEANGISPDTLNFNWRYRDVRITGELDAGTPQQQLIDVVKAASGGGVRYIDVSISEPEDNARAQPRMGSVDVQVTLANGKVSLNGTVLTGSQRQQLIDAASSAVGVYNVESDLIVSGLMEANPGSDERVLSLANSIAGLDKAIAADALLSATDFRFNATVADETQVDDLLRRRGTAGDLGLVISGDIIARKSAPGGEVAVAATLTSGRVILDGVVVNQEQKDLLLASAATVVDAEHVVDELVVASSNSGSEGQNNETLRKLQIVANAIESFAETLEADVRLGDDVFTLNALLEYEENTTELMVIREQAAELGMDVDGSIESRQMSLGREVLLLQAEIDALTDEIRSRVVFDRAGTELTFDAKKALDKLVDAMNRYPRTVVEISGHTDNVGDQQTNALLSLERAIVVMEYLERSGIDAARMRALGKGESSPIASNNTEIGMKHNRRVEFVALGDFEY
jgi:outer membrane protein OmpA-like peptidoglycan-associated protein